MAPGRPNRFRKIFQSDRRLLREPDQLLDDVLQLPNVAGPAVAHQRLLRACATSAERRAREEVFRQGRNVFGTFAKRRHLDLDDPQPIEQVFPELAGGDALRQIAVGGRDQADVDCLRLLAADGLDFAALEKSQQQGLHPQAHLADFVEKQRAAVGQLQLAGTIAIGARETAARVPKSSDSRSVSGKPAQFTATYGRWRRFDAE